jgi:hypothetical protein
MLQGHVSSKDAHEMMMLMVMSCHDHAQMMPKCKANTWGVTMIKSLSTPMIKAKLLLHVPTELMLIVECLLGYVMLQLLFKDA